MWRKGTDMKKHKRREEIEERMSDGLREEIKSREKNLHKEIGKRVSKERKNLELTQAKLAENASLSIQTVSMIECGKRKLTAMTLFSIAEALEVSGDYLYFGRSVEKDSLKLKQKIDGLTSHQQKYIEKINRDLIEMCNPKNEE